MLESKRRWHLGAEGEMILCNNENAIKLNKTNPSKISCLTRIKSILCFETPKVSNATGLILVQPLRKVSLGSTFYPCAAAVPRLSFWGGYLSLVSNRKAESSRDQRPLYKPGWFMDSFMSKIQFFWGSRICECLICFWTSVNTTVSGPSIVYSVCMCFSPPKSTRYTDPSELG